MNRDLDACPLQMLFVLALLLYGLANAMAAEKTDGKIRIEEKNKSGASKRKPKKFSQANGSGAFAEFVPSFTLKDPLGTDIESSKLYSQNGMLIMVTVPNLTQYDKQKRWEKAIEKFAWPEFNAPKKVLVEDLSQQETFKEKVRGMMKEKYNPEGEFTVLVDEEGIVRRQFGVLDNETVLLVVDAKGNVIHHERDEVVPDVDSASRLMSQIHQLADSQSPLAPVDETPRTGTATVTLTKSTINDITPLIMTTPLPVRKN
jgi:hypothetical protein